MSPKRTPFAAALVALLAAGAVAGCGSSSDDSAKSSGSSKSGAPLKVAIVSPSGGALAIFGKAARDAWQFAADQANAAGGVDGHKVEVSLLDTDNKPDSTIAAVRKAVTQNKAPFLSGIVTSAEAGAVQPQLAGLNALLVNGTGTDDSLTGKVCSPNAFRTPASLSMDLTALGKVLPKLSAKTWAVQAEDFATGHTAAVEFKKAAEAAGDKVVFTQYAPLGTTDFGSYVTKLKSQKADGLFVVEYGTDGTSFVNQAAQFKLFGHFKQIVGFGTATAPQFESYGDNIVGWYENMRWAPSIDNPLNKAYVAAWTKKFGSQPFYMNADNYVAAQALFEAVKQSHSVDPAKVKAALAKVDFDSIYGQVSMSADGQLQRPSYIATIVKDAGGPGGLGFKVAVEAPASETHPQPSPDCKL